jgi:hypothetical protein
MKKEITVEMFLAATGYAPENDDLERSNCRMAGAIGHFHCGWCEEENLPIFAVDSKYARKQEAEFIARQGVPEPFATVSIRAGNKPKDGVGDKMLEFKAPWGVEKLKEIGEEIKKTPHEILARSIFDSMMNGVVSEQQSITFIASLLRLTEKELDECEEDDKAFEKEDELFIEAYRLGGMDALAAVDIDEPKALEIVDNCVENFINGSEDDTRYY